MFALAHAMKPGDYLVIVLQWNFSGLLFFKYTIPDASTSISQKQYSVWDIVGKRNQKILIWYPEILADFKYSFIFAFEEVFRR